MQYIYLDSNIFFNQWFLESGDFSMLASFVNNSNTILLISEVVCSEVQNLYDREYSKAISEYRRSFDRLQRFNIKRKEYVQPRLKNYNFKEILNRKIKFLDYVPYENIPQSITIERAIKIMPPFKDSEKGYRDTIIWLSFIGYLSQIHSDDIVFFITHNSSDFYNDDKTNFKDSYLDEISKANIESKIHVYSSLTQFIKNEVESGDYNLTLESVYDKYLNDLDVPIQLAVEAYLETMEPRDFRKLIDESNKPLPYLRNLIRFAFSIEEGIEDPEVITFNRLTAKELYIYYSFNLRVCAIEFTVPASDIPADLRSLRSFYYDSLIEGDEAHLLIYCRPAFNTSFILNIETNEIKGLELSDLAFIK